MYFYRFKLEDNWKTSTVFILNLAAVDLVYCVVCLPSYIFAFNRTFWPFGHTWCQVTMALILVTAHANWFCLGLIALTRCLGLLRKNFWAQFCNWTNISLVFVAVWVWVIAINLPLYMEQMLAFGFNCRMGKCDIILSGLQTQTFPDVFTRVCLCASRSPELLVYYTIPFIVN